MLSLKHKLELNMSFVLGIHIKALLISVLVVFEICSCFLVVYIMRLCCNTTF